MKFAIFEFADQTCEIGETSWIINEDKNKFVNDLWLSSTEILVKWPKEFGKISRKLGKTPINMDEISSILCTATIVKFSDKYETIKKHLENYLKTGDPKTPNRGRGHRVSKKNTRYELESDEEDSFTPKEPQPKKPKYMKQSIDSMLNMVKEKYSLDDPTDNEDSDEDGGKQEELSKLRCENKDLQKIVKGLEQEVRDMRQEVRDMRQIISNMKELTNVNQAITELTKTVKLLRPIKGTPSSSPSSRASSPSSRASSPSPLVKVDQVFKLSVDEDSNSDDAESNMVVIYPGISVLKAQKKILDTCGDAKAYTYSIMEMLWSREVLASHSMTGRPSNAHKDKEPKPCLDLMKINALCALVVKKFKSLDEQKVKNLIKSKLQNVEKCAKLKRATSAVE